MEKRDYRTHFKYEAGKLVPKKAYETEKDALKVARYLNTMDHIIHKMVVYKCHKCGKWHIGRNNKELTEEDRKHYIYLLKREQKYGF